MTAGGFSATAMWPIVEEQKWTFVPQGNSTYTIVNAKNSMRVLAQAGMDWDQGFFVVDSGHIYEDQRWKLDFQDDGSYAIINIRSNRRIIAQKSGEGFKGFAAVLRDGAIQEDERWWLINQEKDETGKWLLQLKSEQKKNDRLGEQFKVKVGEIISMKSQLKTDRAKYTQEIEASESKSTKLKQWMQVEKKVNMALADEVAKLRNEADHARSELRIVSSASSEFAEKMEVAHTEIRALSSQMQSEKSAAKAELAEAENRVLGWLSHFPVDDPFHMYKLVLLAVAVIVMTIVFPYLRARSRADLPKAATLCTEIADLEASRAELAEDNAQKQAIIVKLQEDLDRLEAPPYPAGDLGHDFAFQVFNTDFVDSQTMRLIKVQCPGVAHEDVEVQLIFNGCEVTIARKASPGVEAITWRRRFYFKPSEGLFEFKEDQMQLERGFLHLVFTAYNFQSRVIRFPDHFTMNAVDNDGCWEIDSEGESPCDESGIDLVCTNPGSYMDSATTVSISTPRSFRKKRLSLSNWWASGDGALEIPPCPASPDGDAQSKNSPGPASPMQLAAMTPRENHPSLSNSWEADESLLSPSSAVMEVASRDGNLEKPSRLSSSMQLAAMTPRKKRASLSNWWEADESSPCPPSPVMQVASPSRRHSRQSRDSLESMELLLG